jgi:UDP-N-acetylglucosamine--N-acetylmuramyl-(pentapeptide) pyrophosphoryl-undecaprenol N-acetylglucosamine transferase
MKILLTGGGTGGHFYPLIAIIQELRRIEEGENLVGLKLYYMAPTSYNDKLLFDYDVIFKKVPAGKIRNYFSILNFLDLFKTAVGVLRAIWSVFLIYPDVVIGKGGYGSFPALFAARLFRIPVIIHESDTAPGRANLWASKFAKKIAISWPQAKDRFPQKTHGKIAYTGQPIRKSIRVPAEEGAHEYLHLESNLPTVLILGGSQGAKLVNDTVLEALLRLVQHFQIIHQVGKAHFVEVNETAKVILRNNENGNRYKVFDYLNDLAMRMSAGASDVVVTRAGSGLFEIANWKKPAIIIPISEEVSHDQKTNAYSYARSGGAVVIEEKNFEPSILEAEITRITSDRELSRKMGEAAFNEFAAPNAALKIAEEAVRIALSHLR